MNVLYFTDDRSAYTQGYYYSDWLNVFQDNNNVTIVDPFGGAFPDLDMSTIDLVVIGHGAQQILVSFLSNKREKYKWNSPKRKFFQYVKQCVHNTPSIMFSKNDYKDVAEKTALAQMLGVDLTITHSRETQPDFARAGMNTDKITWLPFPLNLDLFGRRDDIEKDIDIAYRGNMNPLWIGDIRERFLNAIKTQCTSYTLDLAPSQKAENFLFGEEYVRWLNRCTVFVNTTSAVQTAGPRFFEAMACGAVPIAPYHRYEGLIYPDEHYIPVHDDFHDVGAQIDRFFKDRDYRAHLEKNAKTVIQHVSVKNQYRQLMAILKMRKIL